MSGSRTTLRVRDTGSTLSVRDIGRAGPRVRATASTRPAAGGRQAAEAAHRHHPSDSGITL